MKIVIMDRRKGLLGAILRRWAKIPRLAEQQ